tara:strand:- start:3781 stop:4260 length:480 start_codon:yes stop_codon:yes gene_type:complete
MKALVLIDFQEGWVNKSSEDYVGDISEVLDRVRILVSYCRKMGYKIVFTKHVDDEFNSELIDGFFKDGDSLVVKNKVSSFYKTEMDDVLGGVDEVVVCGILTNLCVRSFVSDAYDRDMNVIVVKDCCACYDSKVQEFTFKDLKETRPEIEFFDLEKFYK